MKTTEGLFKGSTMRKFQYLLPSIIIMLILTGCPTSKNNNIFYLAGEIVLSSQTCKTVLLTFYHKNTIITSDSKGKVLDISDFQQCGELIKLKVLSDDTYLVEIPEPYNDIGGFIGWIEENGNDLPDPDFEEVLLPLKHIGQNTYPVTGITYLESYGNFVITLMAPEGDTDYFLTVAGNNGFNFSF